MPRAKPIELTPEEKARAERARARQKAAKEEEQKILAEARKRVKRERARLSEQARTADTYRKVLVGAAVLDEAENHPEYKAALVKLLTRFFTTEKQRAALEILGVPPLMPRPAPAEQHAPPRETQAAEIAAMPVHGFGDVRMVRH